VFRKLVLARIVEPTSKLDSLRVLEEFGVDPPPYRTLTRRLRVFVTHSWRRSWPPPAPAHAELGPASLVLYEGERRGATAPPRSPMLLEQT
jgi:hypothetical protein